MTLFLVEAILSWFFAIGFSALTYLAVAWIWVKNVNNCFDVFGNKSILRGRFPLVLDVHQKQCLMFYVLVGLVFMIPELSGWWVLSDFLVGIKSSNLYFIAVPIVSILLYLIISIIFYKKNQKQILQLGVHDKTAALLIFSDYQNDFFNQAKTLDFQTCEFFMANYFPENKIANVNSAFRFNQGRYKSKIRKIKTKDEQKNYEKYQYQLLKIYISYLKRFSWFLIALNKGVYGNFSHVLIDGKKYENLEVLKEVLISNFFAFAN